MTRKHEDSIAAKASQSYVRADTRYLPVDAATGVSLAKCDDVTGLYAVRVLAPRVGHSSEMASGGS